MSLINQIIPRLPAAWQDRLMAQVIASGRWKSVPTFHMLFESYILMGAGRADLMETFSGAKDFGPSFYRSCRAVASQRKEAAAQEGNPYVRRTEYQKALILYFLADWVSFDEEQIAENYADLLDVSAKIDALGQPATEKVHLPWSTGTLAARFRFPDPAGQAQLPPARGYPVVLLLQGNDTVKETLLMVEDELLKNGFAVFNVDQPGWGESRLTGSRYRSIQDARQLLECCMAFFDESPLVDGERVAVFGFSGGGTWSVMAAALDRRIRWMVTVGGALYNLGASIKALPAMQKRQIMKYWGCREDEIEAILQDLALNDLVPKIQARCLIVHGEQDTLVPLENTRAAVQLIPGKVDFRLVPGGDHMCSDTLIEEQIPYIMSWMKNEMSV